MKIVRLGSVLVFCMHILYANFSVSVSSSSVTFKEPLNISFIAEGSNVKFPDIDNIAGYKIVAKSSSTSMTIINGNMKKRVIKKYQIIPTKSFVIPSYEAIVDGKSYKSKEIKIDVTDNKNHNNNQSKDFILDIYTNKNSAVVGEAIVLTLQFKRKIGVDLYNIAYSGIDFKNLIAKQINKESNKEENGYIIQELKYMIFATKDGEISIEPTYIDVTIPSSKNQFFGFTTEDTKRVYSNQIDLNITKNPVKSNIAGIFTMDINVTKNNNNTANMVLTIDGKGSLEPFDGFDLSLDNATVYKQKPKKDISIVNGEIQSKFKQTFVILANSDIIIPPFEFTYFNTKTLQPKTIKTKKLTLKFTPNISNSTIQTKKTKETKENPKIINNSYMILIFVLGLIVGILLTIFYVVIIKSDYHFTFAAIKKSDKDILKDIMPFVGQSKDIDEIVSLLEENIYKNAKNKIDKKIIKKIYNDFIKKDK